MVVIHQYNRPKVKALKEELKLMAKAITAAKNGLKDYHRNNYPGDNNSWNYSIPGPNARGEYSWKENYSFCEKVFELKFQYRCKHIAKCYMYGISISQIESKVTVANRLTKQHGKLIADTMRQCEVDNEIE